MYINHNFLYKKLSKINNFYENTEIKLGVCNKNQENLFEFEKSFAGLRNLYIDAINFRRD